MSKAHTSTLIMKVHGVSEKRATLGFHIVFWRTRISNKHRDIIGHLRWLICSFLFCERMYYFFFSFSLSLYLPFCLQSGNGTAIVNFFGKNTINIKKFDNTTLGDSSANAIDCLLNYIEI